MQTRNYVIAVLRAAMMALALALSALPISADTRDDISAASNRGDYKTVVRLLRPLAEQGDAGAQNFLGLMYNQGEGVTQDYAEAAKWYRMAAEQGVDQAQYNLGVSYANGEGVPQDYVLAHMWLNLAAAQGFAEAKTARDVAVNLMTSSQIAEAQRLAREWTPK